MRLGGFLRWELLVVATGILTATAIPIQSQVYLGNSNQSREVEEPSFGVGFDLTASYGFGCSSYHDQLHKLTGGIARLRSVSQMEQSPQLPKYSPMTDTTKCCSDSPSTRHVIYRMPALPSSTPPQLCHNMNKS